MAGWTEDSLPTKPGTQSTVGSEPSQPTLTASALLRQTYSLYSERFKTLFLIALPPAILAYFCQFIQRLVIGAMREYGWMPARSSPIHWTMVVTAVALLEGAIYWIVSGFFFAGIATNVFQQEEKSPALYDAFSVARTRLAALLTATLATWAIFVVTRGVLFFAVVTLLERLGLFNRTMLFSTFFVLLVLVGSLLSRLGLAIPILIDNPSASASQALRESVRITEGWEPFFMLFLVKAGAVGYAAYWLVNQALFRLYERGMPREEIRPWLATALYICLAAMLESPLFISFSLLYENSKGNEQNAVHAAR